MTLGPTIPSRPARLAIVTGQLSGGGAERQLSLLAREVQQSGEFVPVVFCLSNATEPYGRFLTEAGVEWRHPPTGVRSRLLRLLWLVHQLRDLHCSLVYGILNTGNIYGGAVALLLGLPFIGSIRNADRSLAQIPKAFSSFFCRHACIVIANSASCVTSLRTDLGVKHGRVRVISNAAELDEAAPDARQKLRQEWGIPDDACVVGTVANLRPQKRVDFFIKVAITVLREAGSSIHFVWIGDGQEKVQVSETLSNLAPSIADKIHFPGARQDIHDCLVSFDIFVLTSAYEGMPGALLEAMVAGVPCVATNVPGTRDVLGELHDGKIGVLADAHDPILFADGLMQLLRDSKRRRVLGEQARQYAHERWGVRAMASQFLEVFRDVARQDAQSRCRSGS